MCRKYVHPHQSYFQVDCLNMWLEGSSSFYPSCDPSGSTLNAVSNTFPRCDHQYFNSCNGCYDLCTDVHQLSSFYPSPLPLLLRLLRSFLVLFILAMTWLPFLLAYVFQVMCMYTSLIHCPCLEEHHPLSQMIV
jgi:hypothetical protein